MAMLLLLLLLILNVVDVVVSFFEGKYLIQFPIDSSLMITIVVILVHHPLHNSAFPPMPSTVDLEKVPLLIVKKLVSCPTVVVDKTTHRICC